MIILQILILIFLSFILIKSADLVVLAVHRLSKNSSSVAFIISAIFLSLATSLPELFVSINSGIKGISSLSLGNVIGANIANITIITGVATLVVGGVAVHQRYVSKEIIIAFVAGILPFILLLVGNGLSRWDGIILIITYLIYLSSFFEEHLSHIKENLKEDHFFYKTFRRITHIDVVKSKEIIRLVVGVALLLLSSNFLVLIAKSLAVVFGIPVFLIGLVIVSIGTTLPELAFSIKALKDHEPVMFLGNILGSIIVNSTLVSGIAVVLSPINNYELNKYIVAFIAFIAVYLFFMLFIRSKKRLDKWEALILIAICLIFVTMELVF